MFLIEIILITIIIILLKSKKIYQWIYIHCYPKGEIKVKYNVNVMDPQAKRIDSNGYCSPKCAKEVWLRSCEKEIIQPIEGRVSGKIPKWLNGSLLRNGPGNWKVGDMRFQHLFDCSALLHRFAICNGSVTYQNRFIQTETLKKNTAAQRIIVTEFGTASVPDPCHSIFDKFSSIFRVDSGSDNSLISIYPFGDEFYTFTESPFIHRINPRTLETEGRMCLTDYVGVINHTAHPHVVADGSVFNVGMRTSKSGIAYNIICFPKGDDMFKEAYVVASIPCRWKLNPGYMHTFGITDNYFVIVEQPLSMSITSLLKAQLLNQNIAAGLKWFDNKPTLFHVIDRKTGEVCYTFESDAFFYMHIINQYEEDNHIVIDICCYKDPEMINCMYLDSILNIQSNPNYASLFTARPLRFVLPLNSQSRVSEKVGMCLSLNNISECLQQSKLNHSQRDQTEILNGKKKKPSVENNLVTLSNSEAEAYKKPGHKYVNVRPEILCDIGCEMPRINYDSFLGKPYRYFYAISCDVDAVIPGMIVKVDSLTKTMKTWSEENCYPSEPIFVPSPNAQSEDDGVILSALGWGGVQSNFVGLIVLCAKSMTEIGRCEFETEGPMPKCLHGWFANNV